MKKILFITVITVSLVARVTAQEKVWTMEECMQYAIDNSPKVNIQKHTHNTYKAEYNQSIASFLPTISTQIRVNYGFGRSVDDSYNYINSTSLTNDYQAWTSIPVFTGGQLINGWRLAKVNRQLGMNDIQKEKDDLAIKTMAAYVDVVYYQQTTRFAAEKLDESKHTLFQAQRMEDMGLKSKADVVQIESQVAEDDYFLVNQQNQYNIALLTLKDYMNLPFENTLQVDTIVAENLNFLITNESIEDIYEYAKEANPTALQSEYQLKASKMQHLIEKGKLLPSIYFGAGIYTDYFKNLKSDDPTSSFSSQLKNKRREYVQFTLSFPLFDGLKKVTSVRKARNNVRIAREQQTDILRQLQTSIEKAVLEREGYAKETIQMDKKMKSDEYSYRVTLRQFEEGLMNAIELQTSANTLLQSRANLLQRKLMYLVKCKEVDYYKGLPLIR